MSGYCRARANVAVGSSATDLACWRDVRFTPDSDRTADIVGGLVGVKPGSRRPNKSRPKAAFFNSNLMVVDQTAIDAGFDLRRYAIKPMPAKPRNIIAYVDGSGTALATFTSQRHALYLQTSTFDVRPLLPVRTSSR